MNSPYNGKFRVSQEFKGTVHDGLDLVGIDSKEVHSTVNGVVERAGWENPDNHKQGFGQYVRIKKQGTEDRYYFGHLSEVKVKVGDTVKITDVIGIEGSTGKSTGSHCHYCARANGSKSQIIDICAVSGIPNALGTYDDGYLARVEAQKKTVTEIAQEVLEGKWGNGAERKSNLENAGYNYSEIQAKVNEKLKKPTATPKPTPSVQKPTAPTTNYFPKYSGKSNSLVDALKSLGINSSLSYRGKIAQANGIVKNANLYIGLKSHNEKMFALLKQGKLIKP